MTDGSTNIAFETRRTFSFFLEIYTLGTYSDVMTYVVREPEIRYIYVVRAERFQEIEYFA